MELASFEEPALSEQARKLLTDAPESVRWPDSLRRAQAAYGVAPDDGGLAMWVADFRATDSTFTRSSITGEMLTITLDRSKVLASRIGDEPCGRIARSTSGWTRRS